LADDLLWLFGGEEPWRAAERSGWCGLNVYTGSFQVMHGPRAKPL